MMMTPYKAAKYVNSKLDEADLPNIPPQMMYNYTSARLNAGKKPLIKFDLERGVDQEDLEMWTEKYISKKKALVTIDAE